jgi:hypothetical protein
MVPERWPPEHLGRRRASLGRLTFGRLRLGSGQLTSGLARGLQWFWSLPRSDRDEGQLTPSRRPPVSGTDSRSCVSSRGRGRMPNQVPRCLRSE